MITPKMNPLDMTPDERSDVYVNAFARYIIDTKDCSHEEAIEIMANYCADTQKIMTLMVLMEESDKDSQQN